MGRFHVVFKAWFRQFSSLKNNGQVPGCTKQDSQLCKAWRQLCPDLSAKGSMKLSIPGMGKLGETWREMGDGRVCRLGDSARLALWVAGVQTQGGVCPTGYAEIFKLGRKARVPRYEGRRIRQDTERERGIAQIQNF